MRSASVPPVPGLLALLAVAACASPESPAPDPAAALIDARPEIVFHGSRPTSGQMAISHPRKAVVLGNAGGIEVEVLLDTGAGVTVIESSLAEQLGLETAEAGSAVGTGGRKIRVDIARGLALRLGDVELREIPAIVADLSAVRPERAGPPVVILGTQVFHELITDIDYPSRQLALHRRDAAPPVDGPEVDSVVVPLAMLDDARVAVELTIEESEPRPFLLDTGADGNVKLFTDAAEQLGVLDDRPRQSVEVGGVGGRVTAHRLYLPAGGARGPDLRGRGV